MINLKDTKVLLTGAGSMINREIALSLKNRGAILEEVFHYDTDLLSTEQTNERFDRFRPDYVIHGAGYNGGIEFNRLIPSTIFYRTTLMAMNVLNACASFSVKKVVTLLTSCAFPSQNGQLSEEMFLEGHPNKSVECHGYGKRNLYIYGQQVRKQYGLNVVSVVFNNSYGPYDRFEPERSKVVAGLVKKFVDAKRQGLDEVVLWGTGKPRREIIYCADAAEGAVRALESFDDQDLPLINIGTGVDISIYELAEKIKALSGFTGKISLDTTRQDGQMQKLLNVDRMTKLLNYYPPTTLQSGLTNTIRYYENIHSVEESSR